MKQCNQRLISLRDRKLSRLRSLSQSSYNEMNYLNKAVYNIYSSMNKAKNDPKIIKQLDQIALNTSNLLKSAIDVDQCILHKFDKENDDNFTKLDLRKVKKIVFNKKRIRLRKGDYNKHTNEINDSIDSISNKSDNEYKKGVQKYEKMLKLHQLQGEILLNEQKKKYNVKYKFEEMIEYPKSHFMRSQKSLDNNNKYKYILSSSASNTLCNSTKNKTLHVSYVRRSTPINKTIVNNKQRVVSSSLDYKHKHTSNFKEIENKQTISFKSRPRTSISVNSNKNRSIHRKYSQQILSYIDKIEKEITTENESLKHIESKHNNNNKSQPLLPLTENNTINNNNHKKRYIKLFNSKIHKIRKPEPLFEGINEDKLLRTNATHVYKYLDAKGRSLLNSVVNQMIYERTSLKIPNDKCTLYHRKEINKKLKETFKEVRQQTLIIKQNCFVDGVLGDDKTQHKFISKLCKDIIHKSTKSDDSHKFVLHKTKLLLPKSNVYGDGVSRSKKRKKLKKSISYIDINNK